jgi:hypothetical protein
MRNLHQESIHSVRGWAAHLACQDALSKTKAIHIKKIVTHETRALKNPLTSSISAAANMAWLHD